MIGFPGSFKLANAIGIVAMLGGIIVAVLFDGQSATALALGFLSGMLLGRSSEARAQMALHPGGDEPRL